MKTVQRWVRRGEQHSRGIAVGIGVGTMVCLLFSMSAARSTMAQEVSKESVLLLSLANKAIAAAIESCKKDGYRVSVSVVDRSGVLRAMGRADGAGPHTVDSSRKKAYTAASVRRPTTELADLISKNPALQGLRDMNQEILILGGGLPIEIGGEIVGGIGVGGAPGAHLDDACAQSGLDAIGAAPKVTVPK